MYASNSRTFWKRKNYRDSKMISGGCGICWGVDNGMNRCRTEDF